MAISFALPLGALVTIVTVTVVLDTVFLVVIRGDLLKSVPLIKSEAKLNSQTNFEIYSKYQQFMVTYHGTKQLFTCLDFLGA